ncbi:DUF4244 domain-containing protein [Arthrobacter sp. Br18]|uniref:DUF4244 domain-containing protein n=1 Tax=Arthrobacter sp. Br18 TaxID=1312954 RepID=UPI0031B84981
MPQSVRNPRGTLDRHSHPGSGGEPEPAAGAAPGESGPRVAPVVKLHPRPLRPPSGAPLPREAGMATAEYAIATLAAVGFAALLVAVLSSGEVRGLLMSLIESALSFG